MKIKTINDIEVKDKVVLCRVDLNVPMRHGRVVDHTRIKALIPTLQKLIKNKAKLVIISHFGRPKGEFVREMSLASLVDPLSEALGGIEVKFALDCIGDTARQAVDNLKSGEVLMLENLRFHPGEEANNVKFVEELSSLGDIFINDTFSCSHRKHASLLGLAKKLPSAAGLLLQKEIENLDKYLSDPVKPIAAIVGGSKISTKLKLFYSLIKTSNIVVIGGAMANSFLKAKGYNIGKSLYEPDLIDAAKDILQKAKKYNCKIILPIDVVVAKELKDNIDSDIVNINNIAKDDMILDFGVESIHNIYEELKDVKTIIWNGPIGAFEYRPFDVGSVSVARSIVNLAKKNKITTIAGGGDVVAALSISGLKNSFSYISTAGGAFLEWIEKGTLPAIEPLVKSI